MASKPLPRHKLKRSAKHYRDNEASRKRKASYQAEFNKRPEQVKKRVELYRVRRRDGNYGKGGDDYSHTKRGGIVRENPSKNRARNRGKK